MKKLKLLPLTLCILGASMFLLAMSNMAPVSAPDGVDITAGTLSANQIRWLNGADSSAVNMYGMFDGTFYLHAGGNGAQIQMNPGDVDTQYWYITGWQNNKGIKVFNDHTQVQNRLDVDDYITTDGAVYADGAINSGSTIHANGAIDTDSTIQADGAISASNFSGSSSGTNTGDQIIRMPLGGGGLSGTVSASSTMYMGPFISQAPDLSAAEVTWFAPFSGTLKNFRVRTLTTQPASGSLVITVVVNNVDTAITITVPANTVASVVGDLIHTATVNAGAGIRIKLVNNATGASAQIGTFSLEFDQ